MTAKLGREVETMPTSPASKTQILKRRAAVLAVAAVGAAAVFAPSTSAHQTLVHAYVAKDGTTVVSGYDGGVPVAKATP
jgi:hypothetical protein